MKKSGKKPDYRVAALNKETNHSSNVGAAWINGDGTIAVVIHSFVVLQGGPEMLITLFPNAGDT